MTTAKSRLRTPLNRRNEAASYFPTVMLKTLFRKFSDLFLGFWVVVYILLEELVWETIAKPVYRFIHGLKILQKIETSVIELDRLALLTIFLLLFIQVELLGIVAIGLIAKGKMIAGIGLYAGKIPVAALTFWLFRLSKEKLMTFAWFKKAYDFLMLIINTIKSSAIHQRIIAKIALLKIRLGQLLPRSLLQKMKDSALFLKVRLFLNKN